MAEDYRPEEGRLRALIHGWSAGEPKEDLLMKFINWMPIFTYPLGESSYYRSVDRFGVETWYAPHNLWREIWHALGGAFLTLPFVFVPVLCMVTSGLIFGVMIGKEIALDAEESPLDFKNFFDAFCWALGSCFVTGVSFLIT